MEFIKNAINILSLPQWSFTLSIIAFAWAMKTRFLWTKKGGLVMLVVGTIFYGLSMLCGREARQRADHDDDLPVRLLRLARHA